MGRLSAVVLVLIAVSLSGCLAEPANNGSVDSPGEGAGGGDAEPAVIRVQNTDGVAHTLSVSVETPNETFVHPLRVPAGSTEVIDNVSSGSEGNTVEYNVTVRALGGPERGVPWRPTAGNNLTVRYDGDGIEFGQKVGGVRETGYFPFARRAGFSSMYFDFVT